MSTVPTHTATLDTEHVLRVHRNDTQAQVFHVRLEPEHTGGALAYTGFPAAVVKLANTELLVQGYQEAERGGRWTYNPEAKQLQLLLIGSGGKDQATGVRTVLAVMTPPPHRAIVQLTAKAGGSRHLLLLTERQQNWLLENNLADADQLDGRHATEPRRLVQIPIRHIAWVELADVPLPTAEDAER